MPPDRLLTIQEAAARLSLKPDSVYRYLAKRRIPHVKLGRSIRAAVRIRESALEAFIEAHAVPVWTPKRKRGVA